MPRPKAGGGSVLTNRSIEEHDNEEEQLASLNTQGVEVHAVDTSSPVTMQQASVKMKLGQACRNEPLRKILAALALKANRVVAEAYTFGVMHVTRLLSAAVPAPLPSIDRNFYYRCLVAVTQGKRSKALFNDDFCTSIEEFDSVRPAGRASSKTQSAGLNSLLAELSISMATMASNALWMNLVPRLKRFLKWRHPELKPLHESIICSVVTCPNKPLSQVLASSNKQQIPDAVRTAAMNLAADMRRDMPLPSAGQYSTRCHLTLPLYHRVLRETEAGQRAAAQAAAAAASNGAAPPAKFKGRTFTLLPLKHGFTVSYIPVSKMTLMTLLKTSGLENIQGDGRNEDHGLLWAKYFNLKAVETCHRKFGGHIVTDGIGMSFLMERPSSPCTCCKDQLPELAGLEAGTLVATVDPGFSDVVTVATGRVVEKEGKKDVLFDGKGAVKSYSSARYYQVAKVTSSRCWIDRWNKETQTKTDRIPAPCTTDYGAMRSYTRAYLVALPSVLQHRASRGYRNLRFRRFVHRQKAIDEVCCMIAPAGQSVVVGFGNWAGGYNSPVSRKASGPIQAIKRRLKDMPHVLAVTEIDEFRTSQICSCCHGRLTNMRGETVKKVWDVQHHKVQLVRRHNGRIHKVLHCRNSEGNTGCRGAGTWNRDVNASINMLEITRRQLLGLDRPAAFCRQTAKPQHHASSPRQQGRSIAGVSAMGPATTAVIRGSSDDR